MGVKSLSVNLEPQQAVYFPGQTVMGSVMAGVASEVSCISVQIKFKGWALVKWTENSGESDTTYTASEEYFKYETILWSPQGSSDKLPIGNHAWPFSFILPQNIPSSFEGVYGYVRYSIKAKVNIPLGFDKKKKIYISVNSPLDLNHFERAMAPLEMRAVDTAWCMCYLRGPVCINVNCQRSGAVVGEHFRIRGEVSNTGSGEVERVSIVLKQKVTYAKKRKTKSCSNVTSVEKGAIAPGDSCYLQDDPLLVPAVVPMLFNCRIMEVSYELEVIAHFGCCSKVKSSSEFFIGTVPFFVEGGGSRDPAEAAPALPATPSASLGDGAFTNPLVPSAPPANIAPSAGAIGFVAEKSDDIPLPPSGFSEVEPAPMPAPASIPPNPYPNKRPPGNESCWFSKDGRRRVDLKAPAPQYLSYRGCF